MCVCVTTMMRAIAPWTVGQREEAYMRRAYISWHISGVQTRSFGTNKMLSSLRIAVTMGAVLDCSTARHTIFVRLFARERCSILAVFELIMSSFVSSRRFVLRFYICCIIMNFSQCPPSPACAHDGQIFSLVAFVCDYANVECDWMRRTNERNGNHFIELWTLQWKCEMNSNGNANPQLFSLQI